MTLMIAWPMAVGCSKPPCEQETNDELFIQPDPEDVRWQGVVSFVDPCAAERYQEVRADGRKTELPNWDYPTLSERYRSEDFCDPYAQFEQSHAPAWGAGLLMDPHWFVTHMHVLYGRCSFSVFRGLVDASESAELRNIEFCDELGGVWVCKLDEPFEGDFPMPKSAPDLEQGATSPAVAFGHPWGLRLKALHFQDTGRATHCEDVPMYPFYYGSGSVIYRDSGVVGLFISKNTKYTHSPCQGEKCLTASVCDRKPVTYLPYFHAAEMYKRVREAHESPDGHASSEIVRACPSTKQDSDAGRSVSRSPAEWTDGIDRCDQPALLPPALQLDAPNRVECPGLP
ncbi:MAG: hypothetical protein IAG13_37845 [Deltaproteobacteria bacterium]|nr:hypothetical protein [Nannocystaceae bacterium]